MWETKMLINLSREELLEEWTEASVHADQCALLATTLASAANSAEGLLTYYAGMKGHEIFLMACQALQGCVHPRMEAVVNRLSTVCDYMRQIEKMLGVEPEHKNEWEAFEELAFAPEQMDSFLKGKDVPGIRKYSVKPRLP